MADYLRISSLVRAFGIAIAALLPTGLARRLGIRTATLAITDSVARRIDPKGITVFSVTPDAGQTFSSHKQLALDALSSLSWSGMGLLMLTGVDRLPLSPRARAAAIGGTIYLLDVAAGQLFEGLLAKAEAAKASAEASAAEVSTAEAAVAAQAAAAQA